MISEQLSELILQVIETLPEVAVKKLITDLAEMEKSGAVNPAGYNSLPALSKISEQFPNPSARYLIDKLLDVWKEDRSENPGSTLGELTSALSILLFSRAKIKDTQKVELVWTGPTSKIPVRQTRQVLSQLINNAEKELLIVSFVVFKIPEILELLKNALRRSVVIKCVLESPEESDGKITFQGFADFDNAALKQIKILVWEKEMRTVNADGKIGTLHAKVAVADRQVSFISSANLTVNALTMNMELGLLVYNKIIAGEIVEHFDQLILNGILKTRLINE